MNRKDITFFGFGITIICLIGLILTGFFDEKIASLSAVALTLILWLIWITKVLLFLRRETICKKNLKTLEDETEIIRIFSDIREISSSKKNSHKTSANYVMWECGTILCWVYVNPLDKGIRDLQNNRYVFAHMTKAEPNSIYYNRFSMGCLGKNGEKRWEVTLTNDNAVQSKLTIPDKLETGWHNFVFSWSRSKSEMIFFIDRGKKGNDLKSNTNWPEELGSNLVIGTWATDNDGHYCNTKIAYPEIINKYLDCDSPEIIEHFKRKPKDR